MEMHPNSIAAFETLEQHLQEREKIVLDVFMRTGKPLHDRNVMWYLGEVDPNRVRPRITKLIEKRLLVECGKGVDKYSPYKGRTRICKWDPNYDFAAPLDHPPAAD